MRSWLKQILFQLHNTLVRSITTAIQNYRIWLFRGISSNSVKFRGNMEIPRQRPNSAARGKLWSMMTRALRGRQMLNSSRHRQMFLISVDCKFGINSAYDNRTSCLILELLFQCSRPTVYGLSELMTGICNCGKTLKYQSYSR